MAPGVALPPSATVQNVSVPTLPPAAAVLAARAELTGGKASRALALLQKAMPKAGELAPLLQLEAAKTSMHMGRDPWPYLAPLLHGKGGRGPRQQAQELILLAAQKLPLAKVRAWLRHPLPPELRRQLQAALAFREHNQDQVLAWLQQKPSDPGSGPLALWLMSRKLPPEKRALVAQALAASGYWRESYELFRDLPFSPQEAFQLTFTRGRMAYRLGLWEEAIFWFRQSEEQTTSRGEKISCWLYQARCWEQLGQWSCAQDLYSRIISEDAKALEGWHGLLGLLARTGNGQGALQIWSQTPLRLKVELAPRLCANLAIHGGPTLAQALLKQVEAHDPALQLCWSFTQASLGRLSQARKLAADVLVNPRAGRLRELAALFLPFGGDSVPSPPTRDLEALRDLASQQGLASARQALAQALYQDPQFAHWLRGGVPEPSLPPAMAHLLQAGLGREAAFLFPHLLPGKTPDELAWKAAFLAAHGNFRDALATGERLWQVVGNVPASLLPEDLLRFIVPKEFSRFFPRRHNLLFAVARQESRFNHQALSPVGARGIFQIMPETARRLGLPVDTTLSPEQAAASALSYLDRLSGQFGNDPTVLAAAYNAGESWVALWLGQSSGAHPLFPLAIPYGETQNYVLGVLEGVWLARHLR
ncbi:MAG: transglycosylase SLT domain-containing protein [Thermoanaerobaculaceae bacterium]